MLTVSFLLHRQHSAYRSKGTAAVEFTLASGVLLSFFLFLLEVLYWHQARPLAYLALAEAARIASVHHAEPRILADAFVQAWPKTFAPIAARQAWRIEILSPSEAAFRQHGQRGGLTVPTAAQQLLAIRNDYQTQTWAKMPNAEPSIYRANTLTLRLTYGLKPRTALTASLLRPLAHLTSDVCRRALLSQGLLPLRFQLAIEMHSNAVRWPDPPELPIYARTRPCTQS